MWLLPSRRRPLGLQRFFQAYRDTQSQTPGLVIIERSDFESLKDQYLSLDRPKNWNFAITKSERMGDKIREVWSAVIQEPWLGILNDDHIPKTIGWDLKLTSALTGWNFMSCNDGMVAPRRPAGAIVYSGELMRAVGWMFPQGIYHNFHDDIWDTLGRATGCWQIDMDVFVDHLSVIRTGIEDDTSKMNHGTFGAQQEQYVLWRQHEMLQAIERIKLLRDDLIQKNPVSLERQTYFRATDLFYSGQVELAIVEYKQLLESLKDSSERAAAFVHLGISKAMLRKPMEEVFECLLRAIQEAPLAKFVWLQFAYASSLIGDWPMSFSAALMSMRLSKSQGLHYPEPMQDFDIDVLLEQSAKKIGAEHSIQTVLQQHRGHSGPTLSI